MAVQVEAKWDTTESPEAMYARIAEFVRRRGGRIKSTQPFEARMGNFWMMRFLGFLTPDVDLPIRFNVVVDQMGPPHRVHVLGLDGMGFGIRTGVVAKFRRRLEVVLAELQAELSTVSVPDQIRELARLRDEGILTQEEFERKRAELAKRL